MLIVADDFVIRQMLVDFRKGIEIGKQLREPLAIDTPLLSGRPKPRKLSVYGTVNRPPPDIPAAEAIRPADTFDSGIGARLRIGHSAPKRADIEHAATVGEDAPAVRPGAGVKDFDTFHRSGLGEPFDRCAAGVG